MLSNGMVTALLSESFVHVIRGFGLPLAEQFRFTFPPSMTDVLPVIFMFLGGTKKQEKKKWGTISTLTKMRVNKLGLISFPLFLTCTVLPIRPQALFLPYYGTEHDGNYKSRIVKKSFSRRGNYDNRDINEPLIIHHTFFSVRGFCFYQNGSLRER